MDEQLDIAAPALPEARVVAACEELDLAAVRELEKQLAVALDRRQATVFDLGQVSFIDSSGIALLVRAAERARADGVSFEVRNARPEVLQVIELVGVAKHVGLAGA